MTSEAAPLVSVVIPVYNAERCDRRYLAEALESVANQTFRHFEMIVVDDGSTDRTAELVEQFIATHTDIPIRLKRKKNEGQSSARNLGAQIAAGEWLAFLDQDDIWLPDRLMTVVPNLNEDVDLIYTDADTIDENGEIDRVSIHGRHGFGGKQPKTRVEEALFEDVYVMPGVTTVRREFFARIGGFDEHLSGYEDDDFFVRALQVGHIGYVAVPTLKWRIYSGSYSRSHRMIDSRYYYWRKLLREQADNGHDQATAQRLTRRFLAQFLSQCSLQLQEGDPLAADNLKAALELLPFAGPVERAAFSLVRRAWNSRGRAAFYARIWFLRGLESATPPPGRSDGW
jgi:glycosyltransferase involved in cell wall biosynthesis